MKTAEEMAENTARVVCSLLNIVPEDKWITASYLAARKEIAQALVSYADEIVEEAAKVADEQPCYHVKKVCGPMIARAIRARISKEKGGV